MKPVAFFSILLVSVFGQTSPVPYARDGAVTGPTYKVDQNHYLFKGAFGSIRRVDFRNLTFPSSFDIAGNTGGITFKKGRFKSNPGDHFSEEVGLIYYIRGSSRSQGDSALVFYSWTDGSSQGDTARVFRVTNGRLELIQEIDWDSHFEEGQPTSQFDSNANTFAIRSAHYIQGDTPCCVSAVDIVTFRWDGTHFVEAGVRTELTDHGKKEGKSLPR
jgi:hypothetical protein